MTTTAVELLLPKVGETLGKYTIVKMLGEGGMGTVFEAVHGKLEQRVAIKVLRPERGLEPDDVARFEREARLAARLKTSHAVRIFDVDVTSNGLPYIVMELIDGRDLADELRERSNRVSIAEIAGWTIQICEALTEAHGLGIVHRDIKSSNVLILSEGKKKTIAKLVDFGIAKSFGQEVETRTLTKKGAWVGTPAYMAPEQFGVGGVPVDARTDIWALGVMLYRSFAGRFPFEGGDGASIIEAITTRAPTYLSEVRASVPPALSEVVMKALRKDPSQRYASAEELAEALAPFARHDDPARADPFGPTEMSESANANANASPTDVTETVLYPATSKGDQPANDAVRAKPNAQWRPWAFGSAIAITIAGVYAWKTSRPADGGTVLQTRSDVPTWAADATPADTAPAVPIQSITTPPPPSSTPSLQASTSAKPPAPARTDPNCVCEVAMPVAGGKERLFEACPSPMTPRCMCKMDSTELCSTPWTILPNGMAGCADLWTFGGVGKKKGDACNGLSFGWVGDKMTPEPMNGRLICEDCYGSPARQAAVPNTTCRGYLGGKWHNGTWACSAPK